MRATQRSRTPPVSGVVEVLYLKNAITSGTRPAAGYGKGRVAKAVLICANPPIFMKSERNLDGVPKEVAGDR